MKYIGFLFTTLLATKMYSASLVAFTYEKDYKPLNIINYEVNVDENCELNLEQPINYYWEMGEKNKENPPSLGLTATESKYLKPKTKVLSSRALEIILPALNDGKLADKITGGAKVEIGYGPIGCEIRTFLKLKKNMSEYGLKKIYAKMKYTFGLPTGVKEITLLDESEEIIVNVKN